MENPLSREALHIKVTAAVAIAALVGVGIWEGWQLAAQKNTAGTFVASSAQNTGAQDAAVAEATSTGNADPITQTSQSALGEIIGAYEGLEQSGNYSTSTATQVGATIGLGLSAPVSYPTLSISDIQTSSDTSYQAMLAYRAALQTSLKPLLQNTQPEYALFAMYVQTQDQSYLNQLTHYAQTYRAVASSTATIVVPQDAAQVQLNLINSMNEFASVLDALVAHANDPVASSVLLENYTQAQNDVLNAFQALTTYEQSKTQ